MASIDNTEDIKETKAKADDKNEELISSKEPMPCSSDDLECAVCLQPCIHPVKLPCSHIFCYLCVKGIANQSSRCAMCRQEIPSSFIQDPVLVEVEHENKNENEYLWYYEGRNGWWRYDERTSKDIEEKYQSKENFSLLICDTKYTIDFDYMVQYRFDTPGRKRQIKRDTIQSKSKGIAGLSKRVLREDSNDDTKPAKKTKVDNSPDTD